jgi:hypothetical protein
MLAFPPSQRYLYLYCTYIYEGKDQIEDGVFSTTVRTLATVVQTGQVLYVGTEKMKLGVEKMRTKLTERQDDLFEFINPLPCRTW